MLFFIFVALIILNLIFRNSKLLFGLLFLYLWLLFGWSSGTADWFIYTNRYDSFLTISSKTEFLYTFIQYAAHILHFDFRMFLIVISFAGLFMVASTALKLSTAPGMVLALYAIFTFPMDVTQIRFFLAFAIVVFGLRYLIAYRDTRDRKALAKWFCSIILAAGMHLVVLILFVLVIPVLFPRKITILIAVAVNAVFITYSSLNTRVFQLISYFLSAEKASLVLEKGSQYSMKTVQYVWFKTGFIFVGFLLCYLLIRYMLSRHHNLPVADCAVKKQDLEFALDANIIILICMGLITVTTDFYRVQQIVVFLNYIVLSNFVIRPPKGKALLFNVFLVGISALFAFGALYNLVINSANYTTVFLPLFENNVFFSW